MTGRVHSLTTLRRPSLLARTLRTALALAVTHLSNYTFDGARAELSKTLSQAPAFQVTHSFMAGSQGQTGISPGTYNFGALYANAKVRILPLKIGADS